MKRKIIAIFTFILTLAFTFGLTACESLESLGEQLKNLFVQEEKAIVASVEKTEDTMVVIKVEKAEEGAMLVDVMEYLQEENALTYTLDGTGMVSGINGKANPADWSYCWMLYTSDIELSNTEWGTCEYNGQTLGSSTLGAEALPVIDGGVYVWVYQGF